MALNDQIDLATAPPFRIGPLTVEPALRQVTAAASETLEPRVMQVLVQLAMANGGIVSRDELVRRCWEGRIVGDDVINRVIARLRRLLEEHGDAAVRIETITKVGYRLIGPVVLTTPSVRAPLATDIIDATIPPTLVPTVAPPIGNPRRWWGIAIAAVALFALAAMAWRAANPPPKPLQATLRVGTFKALSPDVPAALPAALESELLLSFGKATNVLISVVREPPRDAAQAYVVSGTIGRTGGNFHYVVNLAREVTGQTPISLTFDLPAGQGEATVKTVAASSTKAFQCALRGTVEARTVPLPDPAVRLFAQYCKSNNAIKPDPAFEQATLREALKTSPDFAVAWGVLGSNLAATASEADITAQRGGYAEAMASLAKAEKLGLSNFTIFNARARLLPGRDWAARGALLFQSAARFSTDSNGSATANYASFLMNVGRVAEANVQHRLTLQINPLSQRAAARHAMGMNWTGQTAEAEALTREVLATWPGEPIAVQHQIGDAVWRGSCAVALAAVAAAPDVKPSMRAAIVQTVAALQSGDERAKAAAADRLIVLSAAEDTREQFAVAALAALDRNADALAAAESSFAGNRLASTAILFQPALARARALPAFAELAGRLGLVDYWRQTGHLPDFCTAGDAPALCAALKRRG